MQGEALSLMLQARNLMLPNVGYLRQYVFLLLMKTFFFLQLVIEKTYVCLKIITLQNIS